MSKIFCLRNGFFILALLCFSNAEAGFTNNGRMQGNNLNISVNGTLDNNGELIGHQSMNLSSDTISGSGLIRSPEMSIKTKIFAFTGTIDCLGKCSITSATPFDENMFKRSGNGVITITVNGNLNRELSNKAFKDEVIDYTITDEFVVEDK